MSGRSNVGRVSGVAGVAGVAAMLLLAGSAWGGAAPERLLAKFAHRLGEAGAGMHVHDEVFCCMPSGPDLLLEGGRYSLPVLLDGIEGDLPVAGVVSSRGGNSANRIDVVAVGDGYTATQQGLFHTHAGVALDAFLSYPPFDIYADYFITHEVEVISRQSGVDNDPTQGIIKDTAMDMAFWTSGIERLLGVNVGKAYSFATAAPDVDLVLAIANSSKYGGAGYTSSDLATVSGGNALAADIAIHEFGHSLGELADEYDYGGSGTTYTGSEPSRRNISTMVAQQMVNSGSKWASWIGTNAGAWDGLHTTYQGAGYYQFGLYRPTNNSMMRSLGRPFNHVGAEGIIIEIYRILDPIDGVFPATGVTLSGDEVVSVTPLQPVGHDLSIEWTLDGGVVGTQSTIDLGSLALSGSHQLRVRVWDGTTLVRDEAARAQHMTSQRTWNVSYVPACAGDATGDGMVDFDDLNAVLLAWGTADPGTDVTGDGVVDFDDLNVVLAMWESGC